MMLPAVDPLKLEGKIIAAGSSTVFPLTEKVAEVFKDEGFKGEVTIDNIGTGAGFERFCKGETDIMGNLYIGPEKALRPDSYRLKGIAHVGGYALQPQWADGHSTGLYSFEYLRRLAG